MKTSSLQTRIEGYLFALAKECKGCPRKGATCNHCPIEGAAALVDEIQRAKSKNEGPLVRREIKNAILRMLTHEPTPSRDFIIECTKQQKMEAFLELEKEQEIKVVRRKNRQNLYCKV